MFLFVSYQTDNELINQHVFTCWEWVDQKHLWAFLSTKIPSQYLNPNWNLLNINHETFGIRICSTHHLKLMDTAWVYSLKVKLKYKGITSGAPSISSMMRQLGRGSAPIIALICVAASILLVNASTLRSSLKHHYQQYMYIRKHCILMYICAEVTVLENFISPCNENKFFFHGVNPSTSSMH